jgi:DNA (cytosine-5)-methyltransferase 1
VTVRYLSVCSGIEAATVAWHPLGWRAAAYSEIEAFPRAVLSHHYPDVPLHGDFTTIGADEYGPIDLLVGGTPCQSFSVAGLRGGLADDRGNLALEFLRLADRARAKWLVWENVPGVLSSAGGRDFGSILGGLVELGYGFAYRVLDAQRFGVPQRRRRVFVVGHLGDWRRAAAVLFERYSLQGHSAPRRQAGERIADSLTVGANQCSGFPGEFVEGTSGTLDQSLRKHSGQNDDGRFLVSMCLNAHPNGVTNGIVSSASVRRLTPRECERLQGFPDDYTRIPYRGKSAADGPRYKALGNSMAVPVMRWIGERINMLNASRACAIAEPLREASTLNRGNENV